MYFVDLLEYQLRGLKRVAVIKHIVLSVLLVLVSTACYFVPTYFASSKGVDLDMINPRFYNHYLFRTAGAFILTAVYSWLFFWFVPARLLIVKIVSLWLAAMETVTAITHLINKIVFKDGYDPNEILITLGLFSIGCSFIFYRAIYKKKSDTFKPDRTYVIYYLPKDIPGILNYLYDHSGHKAIYQDLKIYAFKKTTGKIRSTPAICGYFENHDIRLKEVPRIKNIETIIGKKYDLKSFNCNHLEKYATEH